jgi:hypothetical protein
MGQLFFEKRFAPAIIDGTKTTTLRRWKSRRVKAGGRALAPGIGWLNILSCDLVELKHLTRADAIADGFPSLKALFKALKEIYPDQKGDGRQWFRVVFSMDSCDTAPSNNARKRVVRQIRADLDKAVRQSGSLFLL